MGQEHARELGGRDPGAAEPGQQRGPLELMPGVDEPAISRPAVEEEDVGHEHRAEVMKGADDVAGAHRGEDTREG